MTKVKPIVILITSTRSGTGKTLLALAAAILSMERGAQVLGLDLNFSNPDFARMLLTLMSSEAKRTPSSLEINQIPYPFYHFSDKRDVLSILLSANPFYPLSSDEVWKIIDTVITDVKADASAREELNTRPVEVSLDVNHSRLLGRKIVIIETNLNITSLCTLSDSSIITRLKEKAKLMIFHVWSLTPFLSKLRLEPILGRYRLSSTKQEHGQEGKYLRELTEEIKVLLTRLKSLNLESDVVNVFTPKFYQLEKKWPTRISESRSILTEDQEEILDSLPVKDIPISLLSLSEILEGVAFNIITNDAAYLWGAEGLIGELFGELLTYFEMKGYLPSNVILIPHLRLNAHRLSDFLSVEAQVSRVQALRNFKSVLSEVMRPLNGHFFKLIK